MKIPFALLLFAVASQVAPLPFSAGHAFRLLPLTSQGGGTGLAVAVQQDSEFVPLLVLPPRWAMNNPPRRHKYIHNLYK